MSDQTFAAYRPYFLQVRDGDPHDGLRLVQELAASAPDDDHHLCALGVALFETLVDCHYEAIFDDIIEALRQSTNLRKAASCSWLRIPDDLGEQIYAMISEGEDIGSQS